MIEMVRRPQGADIAEVAEACGLPPKVTGLHLDRLYQAGLIARARPRMRKVRYFGTPAEAARWLERQQAARWRIDLQGSCDPGVDPPVKVRPRKVCGQTDGPADISRAVVTVCPSPAVGSTRFLVDPASRPYGAGFAAAGIGRDVTSGKPWR